MNRQKRIGIAVFITIAILVITTGAVFAAALTQVGPWWTAESEGNGEYWGPMHGRQSGWSSEEPLPPMHDARIAAVAEATGLTVDQIETRLAAGERLFSIAVDAGMTEEAYFNLMTETRAAFLAEAVEAGWITQEQYQWMLERRENAPYGRGFGGCHQFDAEGGLTGGRGRGMGRGRRW